MNPSYSPVSGSNAATAPKSPQNQEHFEAPKTHNPFDLSHMFLTTEDYGCYNPVLGFEVTADDHIPIRVSPIVRSNSFETPLMTPLKKVFDTFYVPMFAILPNTWDYIYSTPTQGDDVPSDANCYIPDFRQLLLDCFNTIFSRLNLASSTGSTLYYYSCFCVWFLAEVFFSNGSLLNRFGYKLHPLMSSGDDIYSSSDNFDFFFDAFMSKYCPSTYFDVTVSSNESESIVRRYYVSGSSVPSPSDGIKSFGLTLHEYVSLLREYIFSDNITFRTTSSSLVDISSSMDVTFSFGSIGSGYPEQFNYGLIIAYNLCCAQYYVNPSVDFLYNAELYRNTMYGLLKDAGIITLNNLDFERNGHTIKYDIFSGHFIGSVFSRFFNLASSLSGVSFGTSQLIFISSLGNILMNIFSIQNGLRYGDYFTSSKPRPLAIGDTDISVQNNSVDSVDVARGIMMARYLMACNKLSPDYEEQFKGMTGKDVPPDFHFPHFVSHSEVDLQTYEVSNTTSDNQGEQVTRIDSSGSTEPFVLDIDQHGYIVILSMTYMPRTYGRTKFRHFFQGDRFDIFQPLLQNIGDQAVYMLERDDNSNNGEIFGYQGRNDEYKQLFNHASGAFMDILKSWAFVADGSDSLGYKLDSERTISPDYIRCYPAEFDRFLPVDSYLSLGHHYHFIVAYNIECISNRPMISSPSLL